MLVNIELATNTKFGAPKLWTAIAQLCGYTDQSHFIKEFKNFCGFNPKKFIFEEFDQQEPNFFPLDRKG